MTNTEAVIARILANEDMPSPQDIGDGAGLTGAGGQTQAWCDQYGVPFPKDETQAEANLIVWLAKTNLQAVVDRSLPLALPICDWAYNSGTGPAVKALQVSLGVTPDGVIGPKTIAALNQPSVNANQLSVAMARQRVGFLASGITHGVIAARFCSGLIERAMSFV